MQPLSRQSLVKLTSPLRISVLNCDPVRIFRAISTALVYPRGRFAPVQSIKYNPACPSQGAIFEPMATNNESNLPVVRTTQRINSGHVQLRAARRHARRR